jgi:hypothetical protein
MLLVGIAIEIMRFYPNWWPTAGGLFALAGLIAGLTRIALYDVTIEPGFVGPRLGAETPPTIVE